MRYVFTEFFFPVQFNHQLTHCLIPISQSAVVSIVRRTCYSSSRTPLRLSCSADKKYRTKTVPVFRACYARHASSSNPYPYPNNLNPTPHQIFHLPKGASRADVKARCTSQSMQPYFTVLVLSLRNSVCLG